MSLRARGERSCEQESNKQFGAKVKRTTYAIGDIRRIATAAGMEARSG